jgi:hypothetical protein
MHFRLYAMINSTFAVDFYYDDVTFHQLFKCQKRLKQNWFTTTRFEWDRVVALPRHKFVTGATLLQLVANPWRIGDRFV